MRDAAAAAAGKGGNYGCKRREALLPMGAGAAAGARTQDTRAEATGVESESEGMNVCC